MGINGKRVGCVCARIQRGVFLSILLQAVGASSARADLLDSRASARVNAGVALMMTQDQISLLRYNKLGYLGELQLAYLLIPWLDAYVLLNGDVFPGHLAERGRATGAVLAPGVGLRAGFFRTDVGPYLQIDGGAAFTGTLTRPFFRLGVGVDFRIAKSMYLGPLVGYSQVLQHNIPGATTDAGFLFIALSFTVRGTDPIEEAKRPPPRVVRIKEYVNLPPARPTEALMELVEKALPRERKTVELLAPVLFRFDSDQLEPVGVAMLHEVAAELAKRKDIELVEVQGYTDIRGSDDYNAELSERRAQRVVDWLVAHGVEPERLRVAARGEQAPVEVGEQEQQHQQNRRVIFRVVRMKGDTQ